MIYTSSYFNNDIKEMTKVRISVSQPKGIGYDTIPWLTVAPDWYTLLKPYKDGVIDDNEYTKRYLKQLEGNKQKIVSEYKTLLNRYGSFVMLCWCKKGNFCHRRLLAEWLKEQGFEEVKEL